jgi:antitoxin VapB
MPLTLSSAAVDRLAQELAALTGETVEDAVARALRDRLERERRRRHEREELLARARRIVRAAGPGGGAAAGDPSAFLYDERGLPA